MASFTALFVFRLGIIRLTPPEFSASDNPASDHKSFLTRTLTFLYLPAFNFGLLLCPLGLSFDWSMDAIKLVESFADCRNLVTVVFYSCLLLLLTKALFCINHSVKNQEINHYSPSPNENQPKNKVNCATLEKNDHSFPHTNGVTKAKKAHNESNDGGPANYFECSKESTNEASTQASSPVSQPHYNTCHAIFFSLSLTILPFLPASNLFFYVGFVVAERVLYIPSLGYCLLIAVAMDTLITSLKNVKKDISFGRKNCHFNALKQENCRKKNGKHFGKDKMELIEGSLSKRFVQHTVV